MQALTVKPWNAPYNISTGYYPRKDSGSYIKHSTLCSKTATTVASGTYGWAACGQNTTSTGLNNKPLNSS